MTEEMTEEMTALARRAVACKGWRWMPGMVVRPVLSDGTVEATVGVVVGFMDILPSVWWPDLRSTRVHHPTEHLLPDLTDPATLGCLLALVREAWEEPLKLWNGYIEVQRDHRSLFFAVQFQHDADGFLQEQHRGTGRSEAEALVVALEAAPEKE